MPRPIEFRTYRRDECVTFRKTDEPFGGLSNMAPGYPLCVNGVPIGTAEAIYQACRFPYRPDVQRLIIGQTSPMTAKMRSKPYREDTRPDWESVRVTIMRWSLRVKLVQNWNKFAALLLETGDKPIVEDSRKDDFWEPSLRRKTPPFSSAATYWGGFSWSFAPKFATPPLMNGARSVRRGFPTFFCSSGLSASF
ncbi:MAG: NADAR family protein [Bryobacterales bacterium]|nr:NADAR family protein [Bryobacterales bacterium]